MAKQLGSTTESIIDDHLSEFEYEGDSDEEIEEWVQRRNENEADIRFVRFYNYLDMSNLILYPCSLRKVLSNILTK